MSAQEIIEQIKGLPSEERRRVFEFVRGAESEHPAGESPVRYADEATFERAVDCVFSKHEELFRRLAE